MKKRQITTTAALMLLTAAVTYAGTLYSVEREYDEKLDNFNTQEQEYARITEVRKYIDNYYINDYDRNKLIDGALYGMVAFLGDKWSYYLDPEQFASFNNSLESRMVGIGINAAYDYDTGGILIFEVFEGSPAEKAGLRPLDIITHVDGVAVGETGFDAAVNKVRGEQGTAVRLTVRKADTGKTVDTSIIRQSIDIESVKARIIDNNIGYIKIRSFDSNVDKPFEEALKNLLKANVSGIVFDVRNNPGGTMQSLVNILDLLLPEGRIISEKNKNGDMKEYTSDANEVKLPMAVLINEYSISAAEFFAASLQEYGKATIVGTPTTGKGSAQKPIALEGGGGLILSTSKYYTAKGVSLAETGGIKPDTEVPLTQDEIKRFYKLTETEDRQLQAAIGAIKNKIGSLKPQ